MSRRRHYGYRIRLLLDNACRHEQRSNITGKSAWPPGNGAGLSSAPPPPSAAAQRLHRASSGTAVPQGSGRARGSGLRRQVRVKVRVRVRERQRAQQEPGQFELRSAIYSPYSSRSSLHFASTSVVAIFLIVSSDTLLRCSTVSMPHKASFAAVAARIFGSSFTAELPVIGAFGLPLPTFLSLARRDQSCLTCESVSKVPNGLSGRSLYIQSSGHSGSRIDSKSATAVSGFMTEPPLSAEPCPNHPAKKCFCVGVL